MLSDFDEAPSAYEQPPGSPGGQKGASSMSVNGAFRDMDRPPAIVVGLDCITGLQTARILAGHRVPVIALATDSGHFCCRTRVCEQIIYVDTEDAGACVEALTKLGRELDQKGALFPCTDMSVLAISRHREELRRWFHVTLPPPDALELLMDKVDFLKLAQERELPIPRTVFLTTREDAEEAAMALSYPAVVKPRVKSWEWQQQGLAKVYRVQEPSELVELYEEIGSWTDVLVAQEWIDGGDSDLFSCNCYFDADSTPLVTFVARKLRQWPPEAGTSSLGEECRNDTVLQETLRLFESVSFRGLGYLEMKRDRATGRQYIIEANIGRPTGRSAIAEAGGVDLLYCTYCDSVGLPLPENLVQRYTGVKWIYLRHDFQSAFLYWRKGKLTLRDWWSSWRGKKVEAVFSWSDPLPFCHDVISTVAELARRRGHSLRTLSVPD
ncbi:MAG: carboxylate--amine ligase [Actinomycetota bacterium]|nr:carboxylate--amine ligase [Actinomycetota bacterium]